MAVGGAFCFTPRPNFPRPHTPPTPLRLARYAIFCFDQLYIKFAVDGTAVDSNWGRVFYTNLWASILAGAITAATEPRTLMTVHWTAYSLGAPPPPLPRAVPSAYAREAS